MESLTIKAPGDIFNLIISNLAASVRAVLASALYTADETSLLAQVTHRLASAYLTSVRGCLGCFVVRFPLLSQRGQTRQSEGNPKTSCKLYKEATQ